MKSLKLKNLVAVALMAVTIATVSPVAASAAWKQDSQNKWNWTEDGSNTTGWKSIDGNWYFFNGDGEMQTGWIKDGSSWYYADPSGALKTNWIFDGQSWYLTNVSGVMQTGWVNNNGSWYYLSESGAMKTGLTEINGKTYYLSESGAMKTGNVTINGQSYTFDASGEKVNTTATTSTESTTAASDTAASTGSSGGSGGGGGTSSSDNSYSYKDLYGTWEVGDYSAINTISESNKALLDSLVGKDFIIAKDSISYSYMTISNPKVTESNMTSSAFEKKWGVSLEDVGISGDKVKCVNIYDSKSGHSANLIIASDGDVYAILGGAFFQMEKK